MTLRPETKLVIANQISADFGEALRGHPAKPKVIDCLNTERPWLIPEQADVLVTIPYASWATEDARIAEHDLPRLKWIQLFSTGIERMPAWLLRDRLGGCGRGHTSPQIAEFVLATMLMREKRLDQIRARSLKDWVKTPIGTLEGKTLGILGFGSIGEEIARRARAFDMKIFACRRGEWTSAPEGVEPLPDPAAVLAVSDHAVVALPLTQATRGSLDIRVLGRAKPGLHLINISRGAIIVQEDLKTLLDEGTIGFASLDVTDPEPLPASHPFWKDDQVFLTPHVSFMGGDPFGRFLEKTMSNLTAFVKGAPMQDLVDVERGY